MRPSLREDHEVVVRKAQTHIRSLACRSRTSGAPRDWNFPIRRDWHRPAASRHLSIERLGRHSSVLDVELLGLDREHHLGRAAGILALHDLQGTLDALGLYRYSIPGGTSAYFNRDSYHLMAPSCVEIASISTSLRHFFTTLL